MLAASLSDGILSKSSDMSGRNFGLCHRCREMGHFFVDCLNKRQCPRCKLGFVKCFRVERETKNKGKLFNCCSANCKYWEWVDEGASSSGLSNITMNVESHAAVEEVEQFSRMFHSLCRVTEERNIEIFLNLTRRKANEIAGVDKKGKGPA